MASVLTVADLARGDLQALLGRYGLHLVEVEPDARIPASFWGEPEAGIVGLNVYVRADTPLHSLLHEACHTVCMTARRRAVLERDAGGDDLEEAAVCYLQIILAGHLPTVGRERLMADMDAWGYSFRLGSTAAWFGRDAEDARGWLVEHGLIAADGEPTFGLRA